MKTVTVISDLHVGSALGLLPLTGIKKDEGNIEYPGSMQSNVYRAWESFFKYSNETSKGAKSRTLIINGDTIEGFHHNTVALVTNNIQTQEAAAIDILKPITKQFDATYLIRGTEAHVQASAQSEERIGASIEAQPNETGNHSWWQLWLDVDGVIFNIAHHIGTTSSAAYESSAVMREMIAALVEAGQWEQQLPDVLVRSHRHRFIEVSIPSQRGRIRAVVTPGWQLRTPFIERVDRMRLPHIGGVIFVVRDGICQVNEKIYPFRNGHTMKV